MHGKPYELEKQRKGEGKEKREEANVRRKREGAAAVWTRDGRRRVES